MAKKTRAIYEERGPDGKVQVWYIENLWKASARLPVNTRPLRFFEPGITRWLNRKGPVEEHFKATGKDSLTLETFVECRIEGWKRRGGRHLARVRQASLEYPVLLSPEGLLIDGYHRFVKAYLSGEDTIRYKQFAKLPPADRVEDRKGVSLEAFNDEFSRSMEWVDEKGLVLPASAKW